MNVVDPPARRIFARRWSCLVATAMVGLVGVGCTAGKGKVAPVETASPQQAGDPPVTRFAAVAAETTALPAAEIPPARIEALSIRSELRAFDGAPPVIPHEIEQIASTDCLRCHGDGPAADDKGAPKVPHVFLASCTQCHVEQESEWFFEVELAPSTFVGRPAPEGGVRAFTGAPPVMPHTTLMRSNCLSCHGPFGLAPLRSSHPERQSCRQCHAAPADLNQRNN
ncbi:MAG: nitrate reductase cytochrome c-type subunit [Planctomycetota bacterium]|jgi:nitrate reductase cytochrome c-type subunit